VRRKVPRRAGTYRSCGKRRCVIDAWDIGLRHLHDGLPDERHLFADALVGLGHQLLSPLPKDGKNRKLVICELDVVSLPQTESSAPPAPCGAAPDIDLRELVAETQRLYDIAPLARRVELPAHGIRPPVDAGKYEVSLGELFLRRELRRFSKPT
jgi:hypothetical protein